ncbi:MAG: hypothetical protein OXB84_05570 [Halobacteriovoraceae bacterium]|nr:hypothetical protein [Halobacteriovoraceae bacterium]
MQHLRVRRLRDHILDQELEFTKDKQSTSEKHKISVKDQKKALNNQFNETRDSYERLLGDVSVRNRKQQMLNREVFERKMEDVNEQHQDDINVLEQNNKNALRNQKMEHQGIVDTLNEKAIKGLDQLRAELADDKKHVFKDVQREIYNIAKSNREKYAQKMDNITSNYEENMHSKERELRNTERKHEIKLRTVKKNFNNELRNTNAIQSELLKIEKEENKDALKRLRNEYQDRMERTRRELTEQIKKIKDQHAIEVTQLVQKNKNERIDQTLKHQKEIKTKLRRLDYTYKQNVQNNQRLREEMVKHYEERFKNLKDTLERHYALKKISDNL